MSHSRQTNKKINKLHKMALRFVYDDYSSTFETLSERDSTFSINHQNTLCLLLEILLKRNI